jgi:hypothetical protein
MEGVVAHLYFSVAGGWHKADGTKFVFRVLRDYSAAFFGANVSKPQPSQAMTTPISQAFLQVFKMSLNFFEDSQQTRPTCDRLWFSSHSDQMCPRDQRFPLWCES